VRRARPPVLLSLGWASVREMSPERPEDRESCVTPRLGAEESLRQGIGGVSRPSENGKSRND